MTVADITPDITYLGDGASTVFAAPFRFLDPAHIAVSLFDAAGAETVLVYSTDYSVAGGTTDAGGTVTLAAAPVLGESVLITRRTPRTQPTDYQTTDTFPADAHEIGLDRTMLVAQEIEAELDRTDEAALRVPAPETVAELPARSARAARLLGFDGSGNPIAGSLVADLAAIVTGSFSSLSVGEISSVGSIATMTALAKAGLTDGDMLLVENYLTGIAGGGGLFKWDAVSAAADDGGLVIASDEGGAGRWLRLHLPDLPSPKLFGALGDGVTGDNAALAAVDAAGPWALTPGDYLVSSDLTLTQDILILSGARFIVPTGVTLTLNGHVAAGPWPIFSLSGTGAVELSPDRNRVGYPEWWGCIANNSTGGVPAANTAAINAAIAALSKIELQPSDYYTLGTVKQKAPNSWLCGCGSKYDSLNGTRSTRLVGMDGTSDVLQIGPDSNPGAINLFPEGIRTTGIQVQRAIAPVVSSNCASVRMQFVLEAYCEDVRGDDSMWSWIFNGTVHCIVYNCAAKRTSAGTGGTDFWKGFYVYGGSGIAAGGNASLFLSYCNASDTRAVKTNSVGFIADDRFTDCFWLHCETVSCVASMEVSGNGAVTDDFGNHDLTIMHSVSDAFSVYGIYIHDLGLGAAVNICEPYCGPANGATSAIQIANCPGGSVTITGGQMIMGSASGCKPITIESSIGIQVLGTIISESMNYGVVLSDASNCRITPTIKNNVRTGAAAVLMIDACLANYVAPIVLGKASGATFGIQVLGTTDARNEYNLTGIDSACIAGGSGNKLVRNGVQITATGLTGTNLVSGVVT